MAYENVRFVNSNFSLSPRGGTFASIDTSSSPTDTTMVIKNNDGDLIASFYLSSTLTKEVIGLEYVGAIDQNDFFKGATFFSLQRYSDSHVVIRRWEMRPESMILQLKQTISKTDSGIYHFDCNAFAVEHYRRTFMADADNDNKLQINSLNSIEPGDRLWLGPSSDVDNKGMVEEMTVDYVETDVLGRKWVYFTEDFNYQYVSGDPICFTKYIYLFTNTHAADGRGAVYKLDAYSGAIKEYAVSGLFNHVTAAGWNNYYNFPTIYRNNNLIHINNKLGYIAYRSHNCWLNVLADKTNYISVTDLIFKDSYIYKLQNKITRQDDTGVLTTTDWTNYNYQADVQNPYTASLKLWIKDGGLSSGVIKPSSDVYIACVVRDQYGVGLSNKTVTFSQSGDPGSSFTPADGKVITDSDGYAYIIFHSSANANGAITIKAYTDGADGNSGGQYIWNKLILHARYEFSSESRLIRQLTDLTSNLLFTQLSDNFVYERPGGNNSCGVVKQRYAYSNPGGEWIGGSPPILDKKTIRQVKAQAFRRVSQWYATSSCNVGCDPDPFSGKPIPIMPFVKQTDTSGEHYSLININQYKFPGSYRRISQLRKASHRDHDFLGTDVKLDQFYFIVDVVPPWYSEKNPIVSYIYIRMRPFAFSLDKNTFKMFVRNDWDNGSTGWVNVTSDSSVTYFDAGGGLYGLDVLYNPVLFGRTWHYKSRVYVHFMVYDTASPPNLMDVTYWWDVIDDYRGPEILNFKPPNNAIEIPVDTSIEFDVVDYGLGVDLDSLDFVLEGVKVTDYTYTTVSGGYHIKYTPKKDFIFGQTVLSTVNVADINGNITSEVYRFTTAASTGPWFGGTSPRRCARGVYRKHNVEVQVYAMGDGIDVDSFIFKVDRKTRDFTIVPIVYRLL